ncbi:hypothetical protein MWN63_00515 [Paradonghicola geojensis]|nr:hypothetical protein [Marivivens geojensis]
MSEKQNDGRDQGKTTRAPTYKEAVQISMQLIRAGLDNELLFVENMGSVFTGDPELILTRIGIGIIRENPEEILEFSNKSHNNFNAIKHAVACMIEYNEVLPPEVRTWVSGVLKGEIKCPPRRRGPSSKDWSSVLIWVAVRNLVDRGMIATRNDATPAISACDAVADALCDLGQTPQTFDGVKKIWLEFSKIEKRQAT